MSDGILVHGTCVLVGESGVLFRGKPGSGKSDLAFRLIEADGPQCRCVLVADDQVIIRSEEGKLLATPPETIAGLLELRGLGLAVMPFVAQAELRLVVDLVDRDAVPRLPDPSYETFSGIRLPLLRLHAFDASAANKVLLAAKTISVNGFPGDDGRLVAGVPHARG